MELTDIHNRRANIELVSKRAKEHGYPLLIWPEDKELLRVFDIPTMRGDDVNKPTDWRYMVEINDIEIDGFSDARLRHVITEGYAYTRNNGILTVYEVTSR